jgi:hypothetical protein
MPANNLRGAGSIPDREFLLAFNNPKYTNAQVMAALNCSWDAIKVKLRSKRLSEYLIMRREGGANGVWYTLSPDTLSITAETWKRQNAELLAEAPAIEAPTGTGPIMDTTIQPPVVEATIDTDSIMDTTIQPPVVEATTDTDSIGLIMDTAVVEAQPPAVAEVKFFAYLKNERIKFFGPTMDDALNMLFAKLRELNYSKIAISLTSNGSIVGLADMLPDCTYSISKQLSSGC